MALETATYIGGLVSANPGGTDPKSQGDDHLRMLKACLLNSFVGFLGGILYFGTEAQGATANDYVVTVSPAPVAYAAGTILLFAPAHANTGAAQVQVNALGYKPLVGCDGAALSAGDLESGGFVAALYSGTAFVLLSGNDRVARDGDFYTGTHDFTGATLNAGAITATTVDASGLMTAETPGVGDNSTKVATTEFVTQAAFQTGLPDQTGNAYKVVTTDGTNARWDYVPQHFQFLNNV